MGGLAWLDRGGLAWLDKVRLALTSKPLTPFDYRSGVWLLSFHILHAGQSRWTIGNVHRNRYTL